MKLALLAAALRLACPSLGDGTRDTYAHVLREETRKTGVDPFLVMAIVAHESHCIATADNGRCAGLGQVCLATQSACKDGLEAPACVARRTALFDGPTNLRVVVGMLAGWRKLCGPDLRNVTSGYAGTGSCGKHGGRRHPIVREILKIRRRVKSGGF